MQLLRLDPAQSRDLLDGIALFEFEHELSFGVASGEVCRLVAQARRLVARDAIRPCGVYLVHREREVVALGIIARDAKDPATLHASCEGIAPHGDFCSVVRAGNALARTASLAAGVRSVRLRHGLERLGRRREDPLDITVRVGEARHSAGAAAV